MESCYNTKVWAWKVLIVGIIFIFVRLYTAWDIWVVIGVLMILKAIMMFMMPSRKLSANLDKPARKR